MTATQNLPLTEIRYNQPMNSPISGVFTAALTPLHPDFTIDIQGVPTLLDFYLSRGCHGALLFGTTGEGPSFAPAERIDVFRAAQAWRAGHPEFRLLAGTGTPSLQETIDLTQAAFDTGMDGVVTLPPYYFRKVNDDGLFAWFSQVIQRAVPPHGAFFGYHFPGVSGVSLSIDLLSRLKAAFPDRFAGIKDSSGDPELAQQLGQRFGSSLAVFTGNDRLFSLALSNHAAGCITAMANLASPDLRLLWHAFQQGDLETQAAVQARLDAARGLLEKYPPWSPLLKALLADQHGLPHWPVRPPLLELPREHKDQLLAELSQLR